MAVNLCPRSVYSLRERPIEKSMQLQIKSQTLIPSHNIPYSGSNFYRHAENSERTNGGESFKCSKRENKWGQLQLQGCLWDFLECIYTQELWLLGLITAVLSLFHEWHALGIPRSHLSFRLAEPLLFHAHRFQIRDNFRSAAAFPVHFTPQSCIHCNWKHSSKTRCSLAITSACVRDAGQNTPCSKLMGNVCNS